MVNPDYNVLKDWMFGKLNTLLENIEPNPEYPIIKMSLGEQMVFENEFELRCRQPSLGVVYALLLGWFGYHRFWLNDRKSGVVFLVFSWTLLPALFSIFDALCMRELCTGYNNKLAKQLYDDIKKISPYELRGD